MKRKAEKKKLKKKVTAPRRAFTLTASSMQAAVHVFLLSDPHCCPGGKAHLRGSLGLALPASTSTGTELRHRTGCRSVLLCLVPAHCSLSHFQKQKARKKQEKLGQKLKSKQEAESVSDCISPSPQPLPSHGCCGSQARLPFGVL